MDESPYPNWNNWEASQRDLFLLDANGNLVFHDNITSGVPPNLISQVLSLLTAESEIVPFDFEIYQNHPNPFNPTTTLRYALPEDAQVNIIIYDMMGRIVKTLVNSSQTAGYKSIRWNATNDRNEPVSAGLYLYTIQAGEFRQTKRMVLLK